MKVEIRTELSLPKITHLFALVAEKPRDASRFPAVVKKAIEDARFEGRTEESITVLGGTPRKVTLLGMGKEEAITPRALRAAIQSIAKIARRHRDTHIAVIAPRKLSGRSTAELVRFVADYLAASDYKYDVYLTTRKDAKRGTCC